MCDIIGAINEPDQRYEAIIVQARNGEYGEGYVPGVADPSWFEIDFELDSGDKIKHEFVFYYDWVQHASGIGGLVKLPALSERFCELLGLPQDYIKKVHNDVSISCKPIIGQSIGVLVGWELPAGTFVKGKLYRGNKVIKDFVPVGQLSAGPTPD